MRKRNIVGVVLLPLITFGIYTWYWLVSTKNEMNAQGAGIPTAWLLVIPIVNLWWYWKYCEGVEKVTGGKMNGVLSFILLIILGFIGSAIIQSSFNETGETVPAVAAAAPVTATAMPTNAMPQTNPVPPTVTTTPEVTPTPTDPTNTPPAPTV